MAEKQVDKQVLFVNALKTSSRLLYPEQKQCTAKFLTQKSSQVVRSKPLKGSCTFPSLLQFSLDNSSLYRNDFALDIIYHPYV